MAKRKDRSELLDDVLNATAAAAHFEAIEQSARIVAQREFWTFSTGTEDAMQREFVRRIQKLADQAANARAAFEWRARSAGDALLKL